MNFFVLFSIIEFALAGLFLINDNVQSAYFFMLVAILFELYGIHMELDLK